jgi:hypothetical protein
MHKVVLKRFKVTQTSKQIVNGNYFGENDKASK